MRRTNSDRVAGNGLLKRNTPAYWMLDGGGSGKPTVPRVRLMRRWRSDSQINVSWAAAAHCSVGMTDGAGRSRACAAGVPSPRWGCCCRRRRIEGFTAWAVERVAKAEGGPWDAATGVPWSDPGGCNLPRGERDAVEMTGCDFSVTRADVSRVPELMDRCI